MKLKQLTLENFRGFKRLELNLDIQLTVLVGANGAGKSSVLDALAILLSWAVARVRHSGSSGRTISELDIHNQARYALIKIADANVPPLSWQLVKSKKGHIRPNIATSLDKLSEYAKTIQQQISSSEAQGGIPLFAYYPVNRAVLDIPLRIRTTHTFGLLDAWDEALTSASDFRSFFEWFRNREDLENEQLRQQLPEQLLARFGNAEPPPLFKDQQLNAVRCALTSFLPEFIDFAVRRNPLRMVVQKHGQEVRVDQLSDGEKCLIALVADLARRLVIANPQLENPLTGVGVVLIDEIDLHLHPGWQRMVLPKLTATFPNCQFIVSTHSPQVLGEVEGHQIRVLIREEDDVYYSIPKQAKGLTSNEVLDELMNALDGSERLSRNREVEMQLNELFELIDDEKFDQAKAKINLMKKAMNGDIPDIVRAEALMSMLGASEDDMP
jgi:predicted ATP-binding protein involved in virulence